MAAMLNNSLFARLSRIPPAYFVFVALLLVLWIARPHMLNTNIMGIFIRQVVPLGILVLGQLLVMRVNSIDLSGGSVIILVNYLISSSFFHDASLVTYFVLAVASGVGIGLINGYMVGIRRVSAVIATLAMNIIVIGAVEFLASGKPPGAVPKFLNEIYNSKLWTIPTPIVFWIVLSLMMWVLLKRFVFGRNVMSVGENPTAARFSGVPVERTVILAHALAGLMAGIAAFVQTSSLVMGSVRIGLDLPILAVAATILGGVVFGKGEGGVWGPFFGVLSFALLFVVMTTFNIDEPGKLVAQGAIILLAAIFYGLKTAGSK
ncbi:ABC transporter permease [Roseibium sp. MMSF_3544]|uniref:ABC transporter permease n=1 Tax=unclassified Roseibium TaxID=2629323 RepID=UPI00273DC3E8|nr:ABC transporter permease [Roseibium sp. MMSF_3544]